MFLVNVALTHVFAWVGVDVSEHLKAQLAAPLPQCGISRGVKSDVTTRQGIRIQVVIAEEGFDLPTVC